MKESLVPRQNIILLPLHIKWGQMKQYNEGLHKNGHRFHFISQIFAGFSTANTRAKISEETQMCRLIKDSTNLRLNYGWIWKTYDWIFYSGYKFFLGDKKVENLKELVNDIVPHFKSQIDYFWQSLENFNEEQGRSFHQHLKKLESIYHKITQDTKW